MKTAIRQVVYEDLRKGMQDLTSYCVFVGHRSNRVATEAIDALFSPYWQVSGVGIMEMPLVVRTGKNDSLKNTDSRHRLFLSHLKSPPIAMGPTDITQLLPLLFSHIRASDSWSVVEPVGQHSQ
jgi:hypothetical protein